MSDHVFDNRPIGVFDSGIGGLTVLKEIWKKCPEESTIYFGDNARAPYGSKSHDTIVDYSLEIMRFLVRQNVKMVVIACNTASAHAFSRVAAESPVPVIEVVTPGAYAATRATRNGNIGIIATKATVNSDLYRDAVEDEAKKDIEAGINTDALSHLHVAQAACPLFVPLAEEGWWDTEVTRSVATSYLAPLQAAHVDTLILGCTHYPLLVPVIQKVMGDEVTLINAGSSVADKVLQGIQNGNMAADPNTEPQYRFFTSDDPMMFESVAEPFLGGGRPTGTIHATADSVL
ncbi:MAG TPA: glutamate racemase [Bacillota bacterium]|nr:glutamate racemase [Bacillota bacterium]